MAATDGIANGGAGSEGVGVYLETVVVSGDDQADKGEDEGVSGDFSIFFESSEAKEESLGVHEDALVPTEETRGVFGDFGVKQASESGS